MNYLDGKIQELTMIIQKEIEMAKVIVKVITDLDINPRCSSINNEHLYSGSELEFILKVRHEKKQEFQKFLDNTFCEKKIGGNLYYPLYDVLECLLLMKNIICLTNYWSQEESQIPEFAQQGNCSTKTN